MQNAEPAWLASRSERAIILHFAFSILNERQGVMSAADGLVRNEEVAGASPATLTISDGWQSSNAPVPKTERASGLRGCNPYTIRQFSTLNKRNSHEICHPLPKPVAPSPELQSKSSHSNPTGTPTEPGVPSPKPLWIEAAINHRLVAQKKSTRLISGRPRSVTARDDQPSLSELRLGGPIPQ